VNEQKDEPNTIADFVSRWKMEVGDDFNSIVDLDALKVSWVSALPTRKATINEPSSCRLVRLSSGLLFGRVFPVDEPIRGCRSLYIASDPIPTYLVALGSSD
jgi:hypothetical protein